MNKENTKSVDQKEVSLEEELDLEIVELEEKIAPRNWNVYAVLAQ